jgi:membrane-bound lytic murein transglycosylase F
MSGSPARILMAIVALGLCYLAWAGYLSRPTLLQRIQNAGELVVITHVSPSTYYEAQNGPAGLEYDLASRFAEELGVKLRMVTTVPGEILEALASRRAHFAAAGLTVTPLREQRFRFTEPYMSVQQQLIYRVGSTPPRDLSQVSAESLHVLANSSYAESLQQAQQDLQTLHWNERRNTTAEDLLYQVWKGQIPFTIADSNRLALNQRFYPELRAAFDVSGPQGLAWAFPADADDSLYRAASSFFDRIRNDGTLAHLTEKYYGHLGRFDYVGTRTFMRHITERLPQYRQLFEEAGSESGIDWRLLAAIGYQESHWDKRAVSPTGVRGIMMLTRDTARYIGIKNRLDPAQSIFGGARYLAQIKERIPERVPEPVRTWLALASYNVGLGHLEDARILTEQQGGDPDSWMDVKKHLPLLSERKWYRQTKHGYARGWEPVRYVENIRTYYDLLIRITEPELMQVSVDTDALKRAPVAGTGVGLRLGDTIESAF